MAWTRWKSDDYGFSPGAGNEVFRYRIPTQIRNAMGRSCDQPKKPDSVYYAPPKTDL
ncbi:hypothetical protein IG631_18524 [Alternaria alternata]|jgi:hypothetical protein|nr:hypothetical protein IG631_18524 [Alternaria alternata]